MILTIVLSATENSKIIITNIKKHASGMWRGTAVIIDKSRKVIEEKMKRRICNE